MFSFPRIILVWSFLLLTQSSADVLSQNRSLGCIVSLAMGFDDLLLYNETLSARNKSVRDHLYTCVEGGADKCTAVADVIIFHEGNIIQYHQDYIQSFTPDMPIKFVNISSVFQQFHSVNNSICPPSKFSQLSVTSAGYHSMCYFWFLGFMDYVSEYDWMMRIDSDCVLSENSRDSVNNLNNQKVSFAATRWIALDKEKYDTISLTSEGLVVRGMRVFTENFAVKHGLFQKVKTWKAPYTNVLYINLRHLRRNKIIAEYMKVVKESECIYSNRWGDMPLWGAAIFLSKEPRIKLNMKYFHGSHNSLVA